MTTHATTGDAAQGASGQARQTAAQAKDTASDVKDTAVQEAGAVGQHAKDQAVEVAHEAKAQARNLVEELRSELRTQTDTQRDRLRGLLTEFADELEHMASAGGRDGTATELVRQAATKVRGLTSAIDGRDAGDAIEGVRGFARRRPGTFLVVAATAGVLAGRSMRTAKAAHDGGSQGPQIHGSQGYGSQGYGTSGYTRSGAGYGTAGTYGTEGGGYADMPARTADALEGDRIAYPATGYATGPAGYGGSAEYAGESAYAAAAGEGRPREVDLTAVEDESMRPGGESEWAPVPSGTSRLTDREQGTGKVGSAGSGRTDAFGTAEEDRR